MVIFIIKNATLFLQSIQYAIMTSLLSDCVADDQVGTGSGVSPREAPLLDAGIILSAILALVEGFLDCRSEFSFFRITFILFCGRETVM